MDNSVRQVLRSPLTTARVDAWIEELRERGVPLQALNILNAVTDELGLCSEMAVLLVQSVEARLEEIE